METPKDKHPYEPPRLVKVELHPEQVVLGTCSLLHDDSLPQVGGMFCILGGSPKDLLSADSDSTAS